MASSPKLQRSKKHRSITSGVKRVQEVVEGLPGIFEYKKPLEALVNLMDASLQSETIELFDFEEVRFLMEVMQAIVANILLIEEAGEEKASGSSTSSSCFPMVGKFKKLKTSSLIPLQQVLSELLISTIPKSLNRFFVDAAKWYFRHDLQALLVDLARNNIAEKVLIELKLTGILPGLRVEPNFFNTALRRDLYPEKEVGSIAVPAIALYSSSSVEFVRDMLKVADNRGSRSTVRAQLSVIHDEFLKDDADSPLNYEGSNYEKNPFFRKDILEEFKYDPLVTAFSRQRKVHQTESRASISVLSRIVSTRSVSSSRFEQLEKLEWMIKDECLPQWLKDVSPVYQEMERMAFSAAITERSEGQVATYNTIVQGVLEKKDKTPRSSFQQVRSRLSNLMSKSGE